MTMTSEQASAHHDAARTALAKGLTYTYNPATGTEVKIFYVAGGSFCRVDARRNGELLVELSTTSQWTDIALRLFEQAIQEVGK